MAVKRKEASINVVKAAEIRIKNVFRNGLPVFFSFSGGKDSTASIILAHEHKEPLDLIIFSEVMFDENISGELP